MDIGTLIGVGVAPVIIPALVGILKPLFMLIPRVAEVTASEQQDGPWRFVAIVIGALWMYALWQAGHAPNVVDDTWSAVLVGIALGISGVYLREAGTAVADKVWPKPDADDENKPRLVPPATPGSAPTFALGPEPELATYQAPRRNA